MILAALALAAAIPAVTGDFDHDGRRDVAYVEWAGEIGRLMIRRGSARRRPVLIDTFDHEADMRVRLASPGTFKTMCGRQVGEDKLPCAHTQVVIRDDTLAFSAREADFAVALWTGPNFKKVWLFD